MASSITRKAGRATLLAVAGLVVLALADSFMIDIPDWGYGLIVIGAIIESFTDWEGKAKGYGDVEGWNAPSPTSQPKFADLEAFRSNAKRIPIGPDDGEIEDGEFALLRKHRDLLSAIASSKPEIAKQLLADAHRIDESVVSWRRAALDALEGSSQAKDGFDAQDYLNRLNAAFPPREPK